MDKAKRTTIRDVASKAGVSIATVSRFLNSSGYIDAETAGKVKNAIDNLGFRPSRMAQGLKTRCSRQIMMVVPDICNPFYSTMYKAVQEYVHVKDYSVILYNTNEKLEEEITAIEMFGDLNIDGLIFCSINTYSEVMNKLKQLDNPITLLNSYENSPFDTVHSLKSSGLYLAADYVAGLGHKHIAYAGGPSDSIINTRRRQGFVKALDQNGLDVNNDYIFEMGFSMDAGYRAGKYFSALPVRPTAICAANDLIALGVILALNECGMGIPEDVSITGMDDIEFAALNRPGLTTVTNNPIEFGVSAAGLIFDRLEGRYDGAPREINISRRLIIRNSTSTL